MLGEFGNIGRATELRKRLLFVFIMWAVYRLGAHIPTPGINTEVLASIFSRYENTLLGLFDMFSGRALSQFSIFALGIMPYISASIIIELLTVVWPYLGNLKREGGQEGRKKLTQYARYGTVGLSLFQGYLIAVGLERMKLDSSLTAVIEPGLAFRLMTMVTLTAGTAFIMWIGEQITERGIGNGISLIIFAGIVESLPSAIQTTVSSMMSGELEFAKMIILFAGMLAVVAGVVFCESGQRRVPIQYAQRVVGRKQVAGRSTHLPLKINPAGVIPPIFANSLIMLPATIGQFMDVPFLKNFSASVTEAGWLYNVIYVAMIIGFCYFYTGVTFNPVDVADNLKKHGGFIPGIRPGQKTAEYLDRVLTRLTFWGAMYISLICLMPAVITKYFNVNFYFGSTALLIVVGVALDTIAQIRSYLLNQQYDGFMKKGLVSRARK